MSHWRPAQMPSLSGLRAIVTGSNSGIGRSAARELARRGATVVLACRDTTKAETAKAGILRAVPGANVEVAKLDLADLASVRAFARAELDHHPTIDILVNNAGRLVPTKQKTVDGFELTLGGNHLGHFALTGLLLPAVLAAPAARVISLSSIAHKSGRMDFDDLQVERKKYKAFAVYAQSKLANLLFGLELDRRFRKAGVHAQSMIAHPGLSRTGFVANGPGLNNPVVQALSSGVMHVIGQDENHGAFPTLFAATAPQAVGGRFYGPAGFMEFFGHPVEVRPAPHAADVASAQRLWAVSEELTGVRYDALDNAGVATHGW
jgi:NAD(P)-dependent dehydrogenase (short-subunit alcohol dehydrogenase family)